MHTLHVKNFGPISNAKIDVRRFLLFIGPQASGKSTIAKLIYFFLHVRDVVITKIIDSYSEKSFPQFKRDLEKTIKKRFVEFWGPIPQLHTVEISYFYNQESSLKITLDETHHRYITPHFSKSIWRQIELIYSTLTDVEKINDESPLFPSLESKFTSGKNREAAVKYAKDNCARIFTFDKQLFFIPAGRSILSILTDQLQNIHPHLLDYTMREFVETVNRTKVYFNESLDEIILQRKVLSTEKIHYDEIKKAKSYVKNILKGEYRQDKHEGKIFINNNTYTKINYASSGQQEVVWILLVLFLLVLDRSETLVVIEEPEAHLFTWAQKDIIEYIVYVFNSIKCDFILTTHSPYILECINNYLYASNLLEKKINLAKQPSVCIDDISGYYVTDGRVESILNGEEFIIKTERIDEVSNSINEEFEQLLAKERALFNVG